MINEILEIAKCNPEGFTIKLPSLESVESGIVAAYLETQDNFGDAGLMKVVEHAMSHDQTIGGWFNEDNEKFYFDSVKVFQSLDEAIAFGRENQQIAIYDLTNRTLIKLERKGRKPFLSLKID
jgi:fructokinase